MLLEVVILFEFYLNLCGHLPEVEQIWQGIENESIQIVHLRRSLKLIFEGDFVCARNDKKFSDIHQCLWGKRAFIEIFRKNSNKFQSSRNTKRIISI